MRKLCYAVAACILAVGAGLGMGAYAAQSTNDEVFANAALRSLHDLARAVAQYEQATMDGDQLGCHDAYTSMQKAAHVALTDMHSMSFAPADAIEDVSILLRVGQLEQNGCSDSDDIATRSLLMMAGQPIMALRYDYSIGDRDWYTIISRGTINHQNPLQYADSLRDKSYSWVSVRPKDMVFMVESDWKAELASYEVNDPSIENSGSNLKAVEVDYRKRSNDRTTVVYFYRTKEAAQVAMRTASRQAQAGAKADAELRASKAEWKKKLASVPYMIEDHDAGFKLVYDVCRVTSKKSLTGGGTCADEGSHDWSNNPSAPYHWFSDMQSCEDAQLGIANKKPGDVNIDRGDAFVSTCVPAPKLSGHVMTGYEMVFTVIAPGAAEDDAIYAELRQIGSGVPTVFTTFKACYDVVDTIYHKAPKDLGVDKDGHLLSDKTKSIELTANCVRVY